MSPDGVGSCKVFMDLRKPFCVFFGEMTQRGFLVFMN